MVHSEHGNKFVEAMDLLIIRAFGQLKKNKTSDEKAILYFLQKKK